MALFTESEVRDRARKPLAERSVFSRSGLNESYHDISTPVFSEEKNYDIFLSHSSKDSEIILGIKGILEDLGYSVYVDWIEDRHMDRLSVSPSTAETLRRRMNNSKSLLYITTENAEDSKWMPWECGYFDGFREKVAIVPVKKNVLPNEYSGQEYLGLYPYCVREADEASGKDTLWVMKNRKTYLSYDHWVSKANTELEWQRS